MSRTAIYPGSFDPPTAGHVSLIRRGLTICDELIVAVARNISKKSGMFPLEERMEMIREIFPDEPNLRVESFDGLLVNYAQERNVNIILRGLRAVADFEYEYQMANMNRNLAPGVETVFLMADPTTFYVSSSLVKEVATLGGDVSNVVSPPVLARLQQKLSETE